MDDPEEEVRLCSLDELQKQKDDGVTAYFVGRMRNKHATNADINRAGVALGRIKDPSSIDTLIESLVTRHYEVIQPPGGPGSMTTTFNKNGGGGGGIGMNQKPKLVPHDLQNQDVLEALVAITGQNFGYDQRAWATWYKNQKAKGLPVEAKKSYRLPQSIERFQPHGGKRRHEAAESAHQKRDEDARSPDLGVDHELQNDELSAAARCPRCC